MKKVLFLLLSVAAIVRADEIALGDGRVLHHAKVAKFFAGEFTIEHDGGIAHVAWAKMPQPYRAAHPLDEAAVAEEKNEATKAAAERQQLLDQQQAQLKEAQRVAALPEQTGQRTAASRASGNNAPRDAVDSNLAATAPHELGKPSMELPHYNTMTTADLRPGISAAQVLRILGKPETVNYYGAQQQWCYARGQVYVERGVATAFQNFGGDVVAASWK